MTISQKYSAIPIYAIYLLFGLEYRSVPQDFINPTQVVWDMAKTHFLLITLISAVFLSMISSSSYSQSNTDNGNRTTISPFNEKGSEDTTIIDLVGDIDCSNNLHEQIRKDNPTYFIGLGDLCYESDLTSFKNTYGDLEKGGELGCLIGNHDSEEDGSPQIFKEAQAFCNDHWYLKVAKGTTLLLGLDSNGDINAQTSWGESVVTNSSLMDGVKNVIILAHKPAHTPTNSHHPVEPPILEMYTAIEAKIGSDVNVYEVSGHNHFMAESKDGKWFISGAGGRSHYEGETDSIWTFLNLKDYGYLQLKIDNNNGKINSNFFGLDGSLIH